MTVKSVIEELDALYPEMIELRRHFHQYPELSHREVNTPRTIANYLENLEIDVRTNVGGQGVIGHIKGGRPGKTVALRADFDALPLQDQKMFRTGQLSPASCTLADTMLTRRLSSQPQKPWQSIKKT